MRQIDTQPAEQQAGVVQVSDADSVAIGEQSQQPPLVSVVIPAHNAEAFLSDAVESVLAQTYPCIECIVVDDGSTDRTVAVTHEYGGRIRVISQTQHGCGAARNSGVQLASGELFAFLDADDTWVPQRVELMVKALMADRADAVISAARAADGEMHPIGPVIHMSTPIDLRRILLWQASTVGIGSNLLITRDCFEALGGFDTRLTHSEDWAMMIRLVDRFCVTQVDRPLALLRRHDTNMSLSTMAMEKNIVLLYDEFFSQAADRPEVMAIRRRAYANLHRMLAGSYFSRSQMGGFVRNAARSLRYDPRGLLYFFTYPVRLIVRARDR